MANPSPITDPVAFWTDTFNRNTKRSWNLTRHLLGIDRAKTGMTPRDAVWSSGKATLYRYRADQRPDGASVRPPVLLVMSLVSRSFILDLQPGNSFVEHLLERGFDVFLLDWGVPDEDDAANTLETYVDHLLPQAVDVVDRAGGGEGVTVFGYCFGGLLALLYAAGHTDDPIRNLVVMATPVDFDHMPPAMSGVGRGGIDPDHVIDSTGNVPASSVRASFSLLTPTADLTTVADFWERLDDDQFLDNYQAMTSWTRDHIPFPGAAFKQTVEQFQENNGFVNDSLVLGGREIHLSDITVPFLNVVAEKDHIVPSPSTTPLTPLVGSDDATELLLPAGHVGLIIGNRGRTQCMPAMSDWMLAHSEVARPTKGAARAAGQAKATTGTTKAKATTAKKAKVTAAKKAETATGTAGTAKATTTKARGGTAAAKGSAEANGTSRVAAGTAATADG
jgi:polyhydroxyalkanoate synthase